MSHESLNYAEYVEHLLRSQGKEPTAKLKAYLTWFREVERFAVMDNKDPRPFQRLLAQNRFELDLAKSFGLTTMHSRTMRRFLRLFTLLELPRAVRVWLGLLTIARTQVAYKRGYKRGIKAGRKAVVWLNTLNN